MEELRKGKNFEMIAREMRVAVAMAEVYGIDSFAANAPLDEVMLARYLKLDRSSFLLIKDTIQKNTDRKLRRVKDSLNGQFTHNQLHFVIACLIRDVERNALINVLATRTGWGRAMTVCCFSRPILMLKVLLYAVVLATWS